MDVRKIICNDIESSNKQYEKKKKVLEILKDKKPLQISQFCVIYPTNGKDGNLTTRDNKSYEFKWRDVGFFLKQDDEIATTSIKKISGISDFDIFIVILPDYSIEYFITKITHMLDGDIVDEQFSSYIETLDDAYRLTLEEIQEINKIMEG
jgi:hypothetical protein